MPDHKIESVLGLLFTNSSCGQLFVYVTSSPGLFVTAAHDPQKKNALSLKSFFGSVTEFL
jgi:hypothetical protein